MQTPKIWSQPMLRRAIASGLALSLLSAAQAALAQGQPGGGYSEQTGEALYQGICQGCHMPNAKGAVGAGAYPALAGDPKLVAKAYPEVVVLRGQKAMPAFGPSLSDAQVAAVVNYVRTHFGNSYSDSVTVEDVKALRATLAGK
jgi:mono/diheme cytochrome c family protein